MRSFIVTTAIAATFASFLFTPSFAKSDHPSQTASKPGTDRALSVGAGGDFSRLGPIHDGPAQNAADLTAMVRCTVPQG